MRTLILDNNTIQTDCIIEFKSKSYRNYFTLAPDCSIEEWHRKPSAPASIRAFLAKTPENWKTLQELLESSGNHVVEIRDDGETVFTLLGAGAVSDATQEDELFIVLFYGDEE